MTASSRVDRDLDRTIYTVSELTRQVKQKLEGTFLNLWVEGQLSNVKRPSSGHVYFTLKDDRSQLPAVMFRGSARRLRFRPEDGTAVLVWGHITVYEPHGKYQIQVERMEPRGKGELQLAFEQLKGRLSKEGLFDDARKQPLPLLPQRLGIVTSPSGAAVRDICRVLHRRFPNLEVLVYPAQVQGPMAAGEIAQGVRVLNRLGGFDVIIVARGGGSLEDLWPFNEESVARSIATSEIPVVSAVGHEVDFTIADFVADLRAPTPSAAAELVVQRKDDVQERLRTFRTRLDSAVEGRMERLGRRLDRVSGHEAFTVVRHAVERRGQRVDEASFRARATMEQTLSALRRKLQGVGSGLSDARPNLRIERSKSKLGELSRRGDAAVTARLERARRSFGTLAAKVETLSPLGVLGRGYSLTWTGQGKLLRHARDAAVGDHVRVDLHRGRLECTVERIEDNDDDG